MLKLIVNSLKRTIVILCIFAVIMPIVGSSVGAIKEEKGISQAASKKIGELNEKIANYHEQLTRIKNETKELKMKAEGKNQRTEYCLNRAIKETDNSMRVIDLLNDISLDDSVINIEVQDDLKDISSNIRVLEHLLKHCKFNQESTSLELMEFSEIKAEEECCKLLPNETDKINKDLEISSIENVLIQTAIKIRDGFNIIKNKITIVVESKKVNIKTPSNINDKDKKSKELFDKINDLYTNINESIDEKTAKIVDIIKKSFSKTEEARLRAMVAFDIINKYKEQGINRAEIIKQIVEPVVRDEMELSFKRCCEEGGPLLSKKLYIANMGDLIGSSLNLAINSEAKSLYEFCFIAFYGTDAEYGFYDILNHEKNYWYDKYDISKDCILCPIIIDIVELNSLVFRLEELEHIGIDADNIRKTSKVFDKIFNDVDDENFYHVGVYRHLTNKGYGEKECDEEYKELSVGDDTLLKEVVESFSSFINDMSFHSNDESKLDIEIKLHRHIDNIKSVVKRFDEKHCKIAEDNPEFFRIAQRDVFKSSRIELYEKIVNLDLYVLAMNWDNLTFNIGNNFMYNFRRDKVAFKENKLTIDEFITRFEKDKSEYIDNYIYINRFKDRFRYLNELCGFLKHLNYGSVLLCPDNSVNKLIGCDSYESIMKYSDNSTDQELMEMKTIVDRAITDMRNVKDNNFILEHEIKYAIFMDRFAQSSWDSYVYSGEGDPIKMEKEFKQYYEEHRYDLNEETIEHLKKLANEFDVLLMNFGI